MYRVRRLAAGTHGQNNGGGTGDDVAAGPHTLFGSFGSFFIHIDVTPLFKLKPSVDCVRMGLAPVPTA
ncbi:MAG: hypothetical protein KJP23_15695, partial [Deltaproteobacteria bacterium]|nr:hypothetical protein [Deltaproteobacteria bacterium]